MTWFVTKHILWHVGEKTALENLIPMAIVRRLDRKLALKSLQQKL